LSQHAYLTVFRYYVLGNGFPSIQSDDCDELHAGMTRAIALQRTRYRLTVRYGLANLFHHKEQEGYDPSYFSRPSVRQAKPDFSSNLKKGYHVNYWLDI
jgi:hypothetical protein